MSIEVRSFLRLDDGTFVHFEDVQSYAGDCQYVSGAIVLRVGNVEVLSEELWDDINWLWPFVVQALDDCRRTGRGERYFPDQPLLFTAEALGSSGLLRLSVKGGPIDTRAAGPAVEIYQAVAEGALAFYAALHRVCPPQGPADGMIIATAASWLGADGG